MFGILNKCELFLGLEGNIDLILKCLEYNIFDYNKGNYIVSDGDKLASIGFILSGEAIIEKINYNGDRVIINKLFAGDMFGEAYACCDNNISTVNVIASLKCQVMFVNITRIIKTCTNSCDFHNKLVENLIRVIANHNIILSTKLDFISKKNLNDKILCYLDNISKQKNCKRFAIPYDREQLADYLCADRSSLSRALSKLKADGKIEYKKNIFTLLN